MATGRMIQFQTNVQRAYDLVGLGQSLGSMMHGSVNHTDMYRAGLVQAVAALDAYVHGVVLDRSVDIILGRVSVVTPNSRVGLNLAAIQSIMGAHTESEKEGLARGHVAQRISLETYQRPDDIASAIANVGIGRIWKTAFPRQTEQVKLSLSLIIDRRNKIVHQCDASPLSPSNVVSLTPEDTLDSIKTIERIVKRIESTL